MDFDLRGLSDDAYRRTRPRLILFALFLVIFVAFDFWFLNDALNAPHTLSDWTLLAIVDSVCTAMAALFAVAAWKSRRPPAFLSVDSEGITLIRTSGGKEHLRWSQMTRGVELLDYSSNATVARFLPQFRWELRSSIREPAPLTKDAFDAVVSQGITQGLRAVTRHVRGSYFGHAECQSTRFQSVAATTQPA